ncbi:MAG: DegT/DnrJ/EryC1/StrS family aminotransferase [Candidatus Portnoybacteria bacterium]|nr:DegT/DnrJ/EryC1/StrS family aminotransferase [Candidatus Portnoybacteria bacterium]
MKIFKKPIFVSISPNAQADDVWLALKLMFMPWKWKKGDAIQEFEKKLGEYLFLDCHSERSEESYGRGDPSVATFFQDDNLRGRIVAFESGRTALDAILQALGIGVGDEVLIQCFTCTAAVNPILWVGAKPVYVDMSAEGGSASGGEDGTYNMSPGDLEKKITPRSKVVIMQHTFGFPAKVDEILEIARRHNLIVLEDCAHSLGAEYNGQKTGTFGDAAVFSFGRSKVISVVFGGAAVAKNLGLAKKIRAIREGWEYPSYWWILQQLFHPPYIAIAKFLYNFLSIGKVMIVVAKKLGLISIMVYSVEKSGGKPPFGLAKMPNALAILGLNQLKKVEEFNAHRRELAKFYGEKLQPFCHSEGDSPKNLVNMNEILRYAQDDQKCKPIFLNFPIQVKNFGVRWKLIGEARKSGIYLESWPAKDKKVIGPDNVCQEKLGYEDGLCPAAEKTASTSINLPTSPNTTMKDVERVVEFLGGFFRDK